MSNELSEGGIPVPSPALPPVLLGEGSIHERLRRAGGIPFDADVGLAGLVHDPRAATILADVHREYLAVAEAAGLPMLLLTDTWRASTGRVARSRFAAEPLNEQNAAFVDGLRGGASVPTILGGLLGPLGDAYRPDQAPAQDLAYREHSRQAASLAAGGCELLLADTLPACSEAIGMARALTDTGLPSIVSFVLRPDGTLLDGMPLADAIGRIDDATDPRPIGYLANCIHPTIFARALAASPSSRVIGLQANTSALSPEELDGSSELHGADPEEFADAMLAARDRFGLTLLGGCCGTDARHLAAVAARLSQLGSSSSCARRGAS